MSEEFSPAYLAQLDRLSGNLDATLRKALAKGEHLSDHPAAGAMMLCSAVVAVGSAARRRCADPGAVMRAERLLVASLRAAMREQRLPINEDGTLFDDPGA